MDKNIKLNSLLPITNSFLHSYSIILFSNNRWLGLILLLATLNAPLVGLCGVIGTITAILIARLLNFTPPNDNSGFQSFNSLLVSLGIGYFYPGTASESWLFLLFFIILSSIITTMLSISLSQFFRSQLALPSLSVPFIIMAVLTCLFYNEIQSSLSNQNVHRLLINWNPALQGWVSIYLKSIGGIFFQPNIIGGMLIALAILLHSRIAFLLSLIGFAMGYLFLLNTSFNELSIIMAGFNFILTAIAIGGVFFVPSVSSFIIAAITSCAGAFIGLSLEYVFDVFNIPVLAIPFNFIVLTLIYAFRLRTKNLHPYLIDFFSNTPEESLEYYHSKIIKISEEGLYPVYLPFNGEWTVTQGYNDEPTHKLQWAYAWDFEVLDENKSKFKNSGGEQKDFYCFDKPVIAPINGTVVKIINNIDDNPINHLNTKDNWGNLIVLQYAPNIFALLCHLKKGSIKVVVGQYVKTGEIIAQCGNSGRSAIPHLHLQLQTTSEPGSPTIKANIVNFIIKNTSDFMHSGIPKKDDTVVSLKPQLRLQDMLKFNLNNTYMFKVTDYSGKDEKTFDEKWTIKVDLWGNFSITSNKENTSNFTIYNGVFSLLNFKGTHNTALYTLNLAFSRFPYVEEKTINWSKKLPINLLFSHFLKSVINFFSFIIPPPELIGKYTAAHKTNGDIHIDGRISIFFGKRTSQKYNTSCVFNPEKGILQLELIEKGKLKIKAERL
ncbi:MAG: urea transporter [bacterium]|nr:urea transporter [bacterium]